MNSSDFPTIRQIQDILRAETRSMHAHELADKLGVARDEYERFTLLLRTAAWEGQLKEVPGQRYMLGTRRKTIEIEGVVSVHPRGFGFVRSTQLAEDVFIPSTMLGGAMHGDTVRVSLGRKRVKGLEGSVQDVLERSRARLQGVARVQGRNAWFEVDDPRVQGSIELQGAKPEHDGKLCIVQITRYPKRPEENPVGQIQEVIGDPGDPKAEVRAIMVRENLEDTFPAEVVEEMKALPAGPTDDAIAGRTDLRAVPLVTIDPEDARDHDDAIWIGRTDDGYEAWVAIADVSAWVPEGSATDQEAYKRSFTVYLPDRAIPMLPFELSANLGSLVPNEDRLCVAVHLFYDQQGALQQSEVVEGVMRSHASVTYKQVARALGWMKTEGERSSEASAMMPMLEALDELTHKLHEKRLARGSLELVIPEAHVILDEHTGLPTAVEQRAGNPGERQAYRLVEEMMLAANETVARWFEKKNVAAVYRVHGAPDITRLSKLEALCGGLGIAFDPKEIETTEGLSSFLARIASHPLASVLGSYTLRSLAQASYSDHNIGHFGLALDEYVHFTSPIRRYPDLTIHRQIKKILSNDRHVKPLSEDAVHDISVHCTQRERDTVAIEREVVELYQAVLMQDWVGKTVKGTVTDIRARDIGLSITEPFVRVLVPHMWLGSRQWFATDDGLRLVARGSGENIKLGSEMEVQIERVDIASRRILGKKIKIFSSKKHATIGKHAGTRNPRKKRKRLYFNKK